MKKFIFIVFAGILGFASCKVQRTTQSTDRQKADSTVVGDTVLAKDTLDRITPDTAVLVPDTVEITVHRVIKDTVSIIGVGDIMMGTNYPKEYYLPPDSGKHLLANVYDILSDSDITFGNLEGVLLDEGGTPKNCNNPAACYLFRTPVYFSKYLRKAGFTVMSLANNHANDFGEEGRAETMRVLDSLKINYAGLEEQPFATFMLDGMKYGFAAFAPNTGTVSIHDTVRAFNIIAHLDSISDIVIASFHGGAEGSKHELVTRSTEYYYGENRGDVYRFSRILIDAGADIVFGHGPHVTRALDIYKNRLICYSLGNFCTYGRFNLRGPNGIAPVIKAHVDSKGKFLFGEVIPIYQPGAGGPQVDPRKRVIYKLQELNRINFPEIKISVDDTGRINYIETVN